MVITSAEGGYVFTSVCLSVHWITEKLKKLWTDFDEISWTGRAWLRDQWVQFWWRSGSLSGSRNPKSKIRIQWIIELPMDFDEILRRAGVWPRDQLIITFWWWSASLSGSGSLFQITIRIWEELAFGGGLCSLSTSSFFCITTCLDRHSGLVFAEILKFLKFWKMVGCRLLCCVCSCSSTFKHTDRSWDTPWIIISQLASTNYILWHVWRHQYCWLCSLHQQYWSQKAYESYRLVICWFSYIVHC